MSNLRLFSIITWIALPTVMYGGYALLGLLTRGALTPFQQTFFRAGHAHAGVLLLLSLLYHTYLEQTALRPIIKVGEAVMLLVGTGGSVSLPPLVATIVVVCLVSLLSCAGSHASPT